MELIEKFEIIASRAEKLGFALETEEVCKTSLILPFISALGYDIYNPTEVIPEYIADVGIKKGEKVDYAIKINDQIIILIECKKFGDNLDNYTGQLFRYFSVTDAKIALLTNGITYKFYSDIDNKNKLDDKPFYILNLLDLNGNIISDLPKITKANLNLDEFLIMAEDFKYINEIKGELKKEFNEPTWLSKELISKTSFSGKRTKGNLNWFSDLIKRSIKQIEDDYIKDRLNIKNKVNEIKEEAEETDDNIRKDKVETKLEEYEAFHYVKSIASEMIESDRLSINDKLKYCGILIDDKKSKVFCKMYFGKIKKFLEFQKQEKIYIESIIDILKHKDFILDKIKEFLEK